MQQAPRPTTVYDFLDEWSGEHFDEEIASRSADMPEERQRRLLQDLQAVTVADPEPVTLGELRPFVLTDDETVEAIFRSRSLDMSTLLLYSHSIALPNPLVRHGVFPFGIGDALRQLAELRELHELGAVKFVQVDRQLTELTSLHWQATGHGGVEELISDLVHDQFRVGHLDGWGGPPERDEYIGDISLVLARNVLAMLDVSRQGMGAFSTRNPVDEGVFRRVLAQVEQAIGDRHQPDAELLSTLLQVEMGTLSHVLYADLAALRRSSDAFDQWRSSLRGALIDVDTLTAGDQRWVDRARDIFREHLAPAAERTRRETAALVARGTATVTAGSFSLSAIATDVASALGPSDLSQMLAGGALSALAAATAVSLSETARRRKGRAVLAHYAALGPCRRR